MATPWSFKRIINARGKRVLIGDRRELLNFTERTGWMWGDHHEPTIRDLRLFLEENDARLVAWGRRAVPAPGAGGTEAG